jgi:hypothetical protein
MRNIGIIGKARSGKDTAAQHLVAEHGFMRLAFADPLKAMALNTNPYVPTGYGVTVRLQTLIADVGWEYAKDNYPEVRRYLQSLGESIRGEDSNFWVDSMRRKLNNATARVVVTDVRYRNEAYMLRSRGFALVRIVRPERLSLGEAAKHPSETELDNYLPHHTVYNTAGIRDLEQRVSAVI